MSCPLEIRLCDSCAKLCDESYMIKWDGHFWCKVCAIPKLEEWIAKHEGKILPVKLDREERVDGSA